MAKAKTATKAAARPKQATELSAALVLNHYILRLFGVEDLKALSENLKDSALEGYEVDGRSHYFHTLVNRLYGSVDLSEDRLRLYDDNISRHTKEIGRLRPVTWKYFQYLALLFTEIYLDEYFRNPEELLRKLNEHRQNTAPTATRDFRQVEPFTLEGLNKLAFWNATGSGKTLLMHVNILQYKHYLKRERKEKELNRIIVLTPNEGLSRQHLREFKESGIQAVLFDKNAGSLFEGNSIEIIDLHKLLDGETANEGKPGKAAGKKTDQKKVKTIDVEAFEGNNLILVDEAHRGGEDSKKVRPVRNKLAKGGFAFEYSATFGQAVAAQKDKKTSVLLQEYAKATLFDYSYKYFYKDGYGKDYQILNLDATWKATAIEQYLAALLLSFYEQTLVYQEHEKELLPYLIARPLAVFVGGKVAADGEKAASDVVPLLQFLHRFVNQPAAATNLLHRLLEHEDGLLDGQTPPRPIFRTAFRLVRQRFEAHGAGRAGVVYQDMLRRVFNTESAGASLHLDNLKGQDGEVGLRVGTSDYFGVINVGNEDKLLKLCQKEGLLTDDKAFSSSLFQGLNHTESKVTMLIGSRKFSEGWSSWRVSTMGLMNIGRGEGSEIIQLFGRGVRLKGLRMSLKRSAALDPSIRPATVPKALPLLETLNIFGLRADYMNEFREAMKKEGLPTDQTQQVVVPVHALLPDLAAKGLKYVRVQSANDFKRSEYVTLRREPLPSLVRLDRRTRLQIQRSAALQAEAAANAGPAYQPPAPTLTATHLAFLDWNQVFFELENFKNERRWTNLLIKRDVLPELLADTTWYELKINEAELELRDLGKRLPLWQELATSLLKGYCEKLYNLHKGRYYGQRLEVAKLDSKHPNMLTEYRVTVSTREQELLQNLEKLSEQLGSAPLAATQKLAPGFEALTNLQHLYSPLLYLGRGWSADTVHVQPVALNDGELEFVEDVRRSVEQNAGFFADKELYLLRNQSRRGIGFFEANNFYPDFILWLVAKGHQYVLFVDPKGLRQVQGFGDPKVALYKKLEQEIQPQLGDDTLTISSFLVSNTPYQEVSHWAGQQGPHDFVQHHVYLRGSNSNYLMSMLRTVMSA
ncbi:DEAD/DEAH box helicase family protein [Hymenobacter sp. B81]|uniref:DEAD/DEAH box helicase family protein n=1 Tax=Hymenobacter sp. B81 TaxID=3344878 RepID=UPI0037DDC2A7